LPLCSLQVSSSLDAQRKWEFWSPSVILNRSSMVCSEMPKSGVRVAQAEILALPCAIWGPLQVSRYNYPVYIQLCTGDPTFRRNPVGGMCWWSHSDFLPIKRAAGPLSQSPKTQALTPAYLSTKWPAGRGHHVKLARLCHRSLILHGQLLPHSCTWNLYPSLQMQHVRPGSSISSSICFRSAVLVTTWPFSLVCRWTQAACQKGIPTCPPTLAWGCEGTQVRTAIRRGNPFCCLLMRETQILLLVSFSYRNHWQIATCHQKSPSLCPQYQVSAAKGCPVLIMWMSNYWHVSLLVRTRLFQGCWILQDGAVNKFHSKSCQPLMSILAMYLVLLT
jgi:hypothetical protein